MELIFLREQDLLVLDHALCTDDYEIVLDSLVPQKSKFTVSKQSLNAENSDYLVVRENNYFYIGIITSIKKDDNGSTKIETKDFLSAFDVEVPLPTTFSGNIANFLISRINENFKTSGDTYQNLSYLLLESEVNKTASLTYEADTKMNLLDLVEEFSKTYGIRLSYEMVVTNGVFTSIKVKVVEAKMGIVLRDNLGSVTNLVVNDTNENSLNKVIFVPKAENRTYRSRINYYLWTDGTVTTTNNLNKRNPKVKFSFEYFSDDDYPSLKTKATKLLVDSSLKHNITFNFSYQTNNIESLNELKIGTFVEFITQDKVYETLVTKLKYKGSFSYAEITLGEYRGSLTDKLKLIDRRK